MSQLRIWVIKIFVVVSTKATLQCSTPSGPGDILSWMKTRGLHHRRVNKWTTYIETYQRYLNKFRGCNISVLELGVQSGGSQDLRLHYFGPQAHVYGVDMERATLRFNRPRVTNFIGDVGSEEFLRQLRNSVPRPHFILDDASHIPWHQKFAFEQLWPHLAPGGVYMVEDIDTSYKKERPFNGGYKKEGTFIEYAKSKMDELQAFWSCENSPVCIDAKGTCSDGASTVVPVTNLTLSASAMHVHDGIIVFEKNSGNSKSPARTLDFGMMKIPKKYVAYEATKDKP